MKKLAILCLAVVLAVSFSGLVMAGEAKKEEQKVAPAAPAAPAAAPAAPAAPAPEKKAEPAKKTP